MIIITSRSRFRHNQYDIIPSQIKKVVMWSVVVVLVVKSPLGVLVHGNGMVCRVELWVV